MNNGPRQISYTNDLTDPSATVRMTRPASRTPAPAIIAAMGSITASARQPARPEAAIDRGQRR